MSKETDKNSASILEATGADNYLRAWASVDFRTFNKGVFLCFVIALTRIFDVSFESMSVAGIQIKHLEIDKIRGLLATVAIYLLSQSQLKVGVLNIMNRYFFGRAPGDLINNFSPKNLDEFLTLLSVIVFFVAAIFVASVLIGEVSNICWFIASLLLKYYQRVACISRMEIFLPVSHAHAVFLGD